jgi:hypothetical protein
VSSVGFVSNLIVHFNKKLFILPSFQVAGIAGSSNRKKGISKDWHADNENVVVGFNIGIGYRL